MKLSLKLITIASSLYAMSAFADYPEKEITVIVPYGAGGGSDIMVRTIAPYIEKYLGNDARLIVENRTGASGVVGWQALHNAKPDGYTIGIITTPSIVTKNIEGNANFSWDDFTIIANMVTDPNALNVRNDSQFESLNELVEYAIENPGIITMGTGNFGGDDHLAGLQLEELTGAEFTFVPFQGAAARNATMGGHVAVGNFNLGEAVNYQDSINILGIMAEQRSDLAPDVPTFKEQGFDIVASSQRGFAGPQGMPDDIVNTLSEALVQALEDPAFQTAAEQQGLVLDFANQKDFSEGLTMFEKQMMEIWDNNPWLQ